MKKIGLFLGLFIFILPTPAYAAESISNSELNIIDSSETLIAPCADVIETKHRFHNGVLQYRRWNASIKQWVDKEWINV